MSSKVLLCKQCGKLFQSLGPSMCPMCADALDKAFIKVKEYLYDHDGASVLDIVDATGVAEKHVLLFLKEGRLSIDNTNEVLKCEDCGMPISSGRYCSRCRDKLANALNSVVTSAREKLGPEQKMQAKMHARYGRDNNN